MPVALYFSITDNSGEGEKNPIIIQYKDCFAELLILLQSAVVNILVWKRNKESDESALYW